MIISILIWCFTVSFVNFLVMAFFAWNDDKYYGGFVFLLKLSLFWFLLICTYFFVSFLFWLASLGVAK